MRESPFKRPFSQESQGCRNCRFHSKEERRKPVKVAGFDDLVEWEDEPEEVYVCRHPDNSPSKEMGPGRPGLGCDLWEIGAKRTPKLDPAVARRLQKMLGE